MGDLTTLILSIGTIILCWVMIRINDKIDKHIKKFRKFEQALKKNSTGNIPTATAAQESGRGDIPTMANSNQNRTQGVNLVAKNNNR
jgi:hypothetical protein